MLMKPQMNKSPASETLVSKSLVDRVDADIHRAKANADALRKQNPLNVDVLQNFDFARFGVLARSLQILLAHGQLDHAIAALRQFAAATHIQPITADTLLCDAIPLRYANVIESEYGVMNVQAFCKLPDQALRTRCGGEHLIVLRDQLAHALKHRGRSEVSIDEDLWFDFSDVPMPDWTGQLTQRSLTEDDRMNNTTLQTLKELLNDPSAAITEIDERIDSLQAEVESLRQMRRLLDRTGNRSNRSAPSRRLRPNVSADVTQRWTDLAERIAAVMEMGRGYKAKQIQGMCAEVGLHIDYAMIGRIARNSNRFRVVSGLIELA